jgi:hypothetical protein
VLVRNLASLILSLGLSMSECLHCEIHDTLESHLQSGQNAWELVTVSSAIDSIVRASQSPIGLPLPGHASRGAAINSYRIASFGRRGFASTNKAG